MSGSASGGPGEIGIASALLMTAVGGYIDAFLFLRHQVFGFAQTGNVIFLAVDLVKDGDWVVYLWPLLAYLAGLAVAQVVRALAPGLPTRVIGAALGFQLLVFAVLSLVPPDAPAALFVVPLSFVGGVRLDLFRSAGGDLVREYCDDRQPDEDGAGGGRLRPRPLLDPRTRGCLYRERRSELLAGSALRREGVAGL